MIRKAKILQEFKLLLKLEVLWIMQSSSIYFFFLLYSSVLAIFKPKCSLLLFIGMDVLLSSCVNVWFGFSSPRCMQTGAGVRQGEQHT